MCSVFIMLKFIMLVRVCQASKGFLSPDVSYATLCRDASATAWVVGWPEGGLQAISQAYGGGGGCVMGRTNLTRTKVG